jgi:sulfate adenylyltransferase subunit 2
MSPSAGTGSALTSRDSEILDELEAEAIWVIREAMSAFSKPVILYSIGKDSTVLLHLAAKAFAPGRIPIPVLHIDTTWKFREMIEFRDMTAERLGLDLRVHTNPAGADGAVTPFTHGSDEYTRIMKTTALRQALDAGAYDVALGGARRDEERSRAKERMFSLRSAGHTWDPSAQRPELWHSINPVLSPGQTMRAFPLSNWTERDVWKYIRREQLDIVSLYFTAERPTVLRQGKAIVVDDERFPLDEGEEVVMRAVRFRTLGCYPLSAAEESTATTIDELIDELEISTTSERAGRLIDGVGASSMERKKLEGYF